VGLINLEKLWDLIVYGLKHAETAVHMMDLISGEAQAMLLSKTAPATVLVVLSALVVEFREEQLVTVFQRQLL